jgi:hypothetical protein
MLGVLYICTSSFLGRIVTGQGSTIRRARYVSPRLREFTLTIRPRPMIDIDMCIVGTVIDVILLYTRIDLLQLAAKVIGCIVNSSHCCTSLAIPFSALSSQKG